MNNKYHGRLSAIKCVVHIVDRKWNVRLHAEPVRALLIPVGKVLVHPDRPLEHVEVLGHLLHQAQPLYLYGHRSAIGTQNPSVHLRGLDGRGGQKGRDRWGEGGRRGR